MVGLREGIQTHWSFCPARHPASCAGFSESCLQAQRPVPRCYQRHTMPYTGISGHVEWHSNSTQKHRDVWIDGTWSLELSGTCRLGEAEPLIPSGGLPAVLRLLSSDRRQYELLFQKGVRPMAYQSETISAILPRVNATYFLPSLQREFVWTAEQVCALFDPLMEEVPN